MYKHTFAREMFMCNVCVYSHNCITYTHTKCSRTFATEYRRPTGCLIFIRHFPPKSPIISCSFAKNDLKLNASYRFSPPCRMHILYSHTYVCMCSHTWVECRYTLQHTATHCNTLQRSHTSVSCRYTIAQKSLLPAFTHTNTSHSHSPPIFN